LACEWGICGVGVLAADWPMRDVLRDQDGLYTLIVENTDGTRDAHVIGSIIDYRYAPDDPEAVIELLAAATTRRVVVGHAERRQPGLAEWIAEYARFPNSMVDRITPATTPEIAAKVRRDLGVADRRPVLTEPFAAWVVEDDFADGRPPLEHAGVLLVDDVGPYELMKLRLLNAGHQCLCY
jgi:mannitol 2-dehydrogenase